MVYQGQEFKKQIKNIPRNRQSNGSAMGQFFNKGNFMSIDAADIVHIQLEKFEEACNSIGRNEEKNKNLRDKISELILKNRSQTEEMAFQFNKNIELINKIGKVLTEIEELPPKNTSVLKIKEILEL